MNKSTALLAKLAGTTLGCGLMLNALAPAASAAFSLVPQQEGEINVGVGNPLKSGSSYLATPGFTITSLKDESTGSKSRLFVDKAGTNNTYGQVSFLSQDIGTAEGSNQYWFRPVAMQNNGIDTRVENGQLEVGTFKINFAQTMANLMVRWFDTETKDGTTFSAYDIAGKLISAGVVKAGANNNIQTQTFTNVASLVLNLGQANSQGFNATGDGVNFQMEGTPVASEEVPEPLSLGGLALGGWGLGYARRRRNRQQASSC